MRCQMSMTWEGISTCLGGVVMGILWGGAFSAVYADASAFAGGFEKAKKLLLNPVVVARKKNERKKLACFRISPYSAGNRSIVLIILKSTLEYVMGSQKNLVLAVDDKPQNLQFLGKLLSDNGYEVGLAQNGSQALSFVKKDEPDLILLDIMMPEMDGYDVCRSLKNDFSFRHIPVIFLSAKTATEDVVKGFEAGGVDYVTKPFNSLELLARIKTHIELKTLRGLLPICSKCKKIRDDEGFWKQVDTYIEDNSEVTFTHGICPDCMESLYKDTNWYRKKYR
jgi:CheY-like chemotaxis protein